MKSIAGQIAIAVFTGVVLILGGILCLYVQDDMTMLLLALLAVLYVIYLVRLIPRLKDRKKQKAKTESPLMRR